MTVDQELFQHAQNFGAVQAEAAIGHMQAAALKEGAFARVMASKLLQDRAMVEKIKSMVSEYAANCFISGALHQQAKERS